MRRLSQQECAHPRGSTRGCGLLIVDRHAGAPLYAVPRWASVNLGLLICNACAGMHRSLGVHISRVRSTELDKWSSADVEFLGSLGNSIANQFWEANLPSSSARPKPTDLEHLERFVRQKYEQRLFVSQHFNPYNETPEQRKAHQPSRPPSPQAPRTASKQPAGQHTLPQQDLLGGEPTAQQYGQPNGTTDSSIFGDDNTQAAGSSWADFGDEMNQDGMNASQQFDLLQVSSGPDDEGFAVSDVAKKDKSSIMSLYDSSGPSGIHRMAPQQPQQGIAGTGGVSPGMEQNMMAQQPSQNGNVSRNSPFVAQPKTASPQQKQKQLPHFMDGMAGTQHHGVSMPTQQQIPQKQTQQQEQQQQQQQQQQKASTLSGSLSGPKGQQRRVNSGLRKAEIDVDPFN